MSDLTQMFKHSPNTASYMLGQQFYADQDRKKADLQTVLQQQQQNAVMNPLEAQFKQGQIAQQQAQLPGIVGQSKSAAAQGEVDEKTIITKIAGITTAAMEKMDEAGRKRMENETERMARAAAMLDKFPPAQHKAILSKVYAEFGGDPNSAYMQQILGLPDNEVAKSAQLVAKSQQMATSQFRQQTALKTQENISQEKIAKGNNDTQIKVAQIAAEARKQVAAARVQATRHMSTDQAIAYLTMMPDRSPEEQAQLEALSAQRLSERAASANGVTPALLGQPTPQQTARNTATQIHGSGQPQASAAPEQSGYKQIGTHKGKPVFQDAQGNKFIME